MKTLLIRELSFFFDAAYLGLEPEQFAIAPSGLGDDSASGRVPSANPRYLVARS